MKGLLMILLVLLSGCHTPKIYIINQGYSQKQLSSFKQAFKQQGLTVYDSQVNIPQEFTDVALATNIGFSDQELINKVQSILNGFELSNAEHYRFKQGNHYYSDNNIGVYLKNPNRLDKEDLPPYLTTQNCITADATLQLNKSGKFVLEYENRPYTDDKLHKVSGFWRYVGGELILTGKLVEPQYYQQSNETMQTHLGLRPGEVFKPKMNKHSLPALNCEFSIVYMDKK
ncbi:hypothetical protein [Pseudoalteromonas denitrificans]|uniref:Lipoprotein n=1 Tax=Pseudoalteromonas denitrificans DSM 6059 TaxID=1123010 RepID=A0A1I1R5L4_9GAMM|nr:hypothetical protein [Pseudoalteromonas denitrificans]SFD29467.1 hypothetical protein SAMN02745724_04115 [Pseudoalteromonas denitrificans DSM 6059]